MSMITVVNDDFDTALAEIETIVKAKRLSISAQRVKHNELIHDLLK